jgi:hypothetical protein
LSIAEHASYRSINKARTDFEDFDMARSTVALLTDFGLDDNYVGIMKCVMADICPDVTMLDICHDVPPQNVLSGAFLLSGAAKFFPDDTVVLGVVDPGVGSNRRSIALDFGDFKCVGPDNGLFDMLKKHFELESAWELTNTDLHLEQVSATFHGRDVFAPVAAHLAGGRPIEDVGDQLDIDDLVGLPPSAPFFRKDRIEAHIIHVDRYGNLITNLSNSEYYEWNGDRDIHIDLGGDTVDLYTTFSEVGRGQPLAYFGSAGQLEVAVRDGSAARHFQAGQGDTVLLERD